MNKNAQECDADHAEGATSGTSDGGIILSLCMNLSSFDNKSITYFSYQKIGFENQMNSSRNQRSNHVFFFFFFFLF